MNKDALGYKRHCSTCRHVEEVKDLVYYCRNKNSNFYNMKVNSLLSTSCHSKYEKE